MRGIESHVRHLLSEGILEKPEIIEEHITFSEYARQLDAYAEVFGRERIHLLLLEDLQKNPQAVLRSVCQFLQIDPDYQFQRIDTIRNSKETLNLHPVLRQLYKTSAIKSLGKFISPQLRQKLYKPLSRKSPYQVNLSEQDKAKVFKRLQPELSRLEADYGIKVQNKWDLSL